MFFGKAGVSLGEYDFFNINALVKKPQEPRARIVVLSSVINWQDSNFLRYPFAGFFRVVVVATENTSGVLAGNVYFLEKNSLRKSGLRFPLRWLKPKGCAQDERIILRAMEDLGRKVESERAQHKCSKEPWELYTQIETCLEKLSAPVTHRVYFEIDKSGFVELKPEKHDSHDPEFLKPENPIIKRSVKLYRKKTLARQAFYYLKYCLHTHTHHSHTAESLTTVHEKSDLQNRDVENLLLDIKGGINDYRTQAAQFTHTVSGIALYGKSLIYSAKLRDRISDKAAMDAQLAFFDNVRSSIDLCGPPQTKTAMRLVLDRAPKLMAAVFVLLGPVLLYLNTRSKVSKEGASYISQELESTCRHFGGIEIASKVCNGFYRGVDYYVHGAVMPSILSMLFIGFLLMLITVVGVKLGSHAESRSPVHKVIRKISLSTRSYVFLDRPIGIFKYSLFPFMVLLNHARNGLIPFYKPKKIIGTVLSWLGLGLAGYGTYYFGASMARSLAILF